MPFAATSPANSWRLALVAMPWSLFNRPSIQLGTLKSFLQAQAGEWLRVDTFHPYLEVAHRLGTATYHHLSRDFWLSEALYAPLLYPEQEESARRLAADRWRRHYGRQPLDVETVQHQLDQQLDSWLESRDWRQYDLIGFSICFHQLFSSLLAAKRLKERFPEVGIVLGGSFCAPEMAPSLLACFPQVDYVIAGEGEMQLLDLACFLSGRRERLSFPVHNRSAPRAAKGAEISSERQLPDLNELPVPDYREYFQQISRLFGAEPFIPVLPVEFSRGCWWAKCTFCNLNLQWCGYRMKAAERVAAEVRTLSEQSGSLEVAFTDNALPARRLERFFDLQVEAGPEVRFFGELRVGGSCRELGHYRRGGLTTVQAGIEALSDSLLDRMGKGVSVLDNVAFIRNALEAGIILEANLITQFPGSTEAEVAETLEHLDFLFPFPPLAIASFFLGLGSPVERNPAAFGLAAVKTHAHFARLFPAETLSRLLLPIREYRGDRQLQKKRWAPVVAKVKAWQRFHQARAGSVLEQPPLSYRDGNSFLLIRQEKPDGRILHHRLRGSSRDVYLSCMNCRDLETIMADFPKLKQETLSRFLADLHQKKLLLAHRNRYLALAVHRP